MRLNKKLSDVDCLLVMECAQKFSNSDSDADLTVCPTCQIAVSANEETPLFSSTLVHRHCRFFAVFFLRPLPKEFPMFLLGQ